MHLPDIFVISDNIWSAFFAFYAHFLQKMHKFKTCALKTQRDEHFKVRKSYFSDFLLFFYLSIHWAVLTRYKFTLIPETSHLFFPIFDLRTLIYCSYQWRKTCSFLCCLETYASMDQLNKELHFSSENNI